MSTWLTILYLGVIQAVIGPLPVGRGGCLAMVQTREWLQPALAARGNRYALGDVTLDCVRSRTKPAIGERR
jgi:hypothetical protein